MCYLPCALLKALCSQQISLIGLSLLNVSVSPPQPVLLGRFAPSLLLACITHVSRLLFLVTLSHAPIISSSYLLLFIAGVDQVKKCNMHVHLSEKERERERMENPRGRNIEGVHEGRGGGVRDSIVRHIWRGRLTQQRPQQQCLELDNRATGRKLEKRLPLRQRNCERNSTATNHCRNKDINSRGYCRSSLSISP